MRLESSWDTVGSSGNSWSVAENWQPKVNDLASMRVPDANAGQTVALKSNSVYAIRRMVASLSRVGCDRAVPSGCTTESRRWKYGIDWRRSSWEGCNRSQASFLRHRNGLLLKRSPAQILCRALFVAALRLANAPERVMPSMAGAASGVPPGAYLSAGMSGRHTQPRPQAG